MAKRDKAAKPPPVDGHGEESFTTPPPPPDDGQAATPPEPIPEPKRKRGRPPGSKSKPKAPDDAGDFDLLDPELAKMAALGPHMLAAGIAARFFDTALVYDPEKLEAAQRLFVRWMDQMQLQIGPGWQYGAITAVAIGQGIMASEPITPEMREAAKKAAEQAKQQAREAAQKAAAEQAKRDAAKQTNGAAEPVQQAAPAQTAEA